VQDRKFICPCYRHKDDIAETGHCICHLFVSDQYQPADIGSAPIREEDSSWPHIVVYGASWCTDSLRTRAFLNREGIPYTFVDVDDDPQAAEKVRDWNSGRLSTPTLDIEGRIVSVPSDEALAGLLRVGQSSIEHGS
jgi:mycoredoxin